MADELKAIIDSVHARLQAELEAQLNGLKERHQQELAEARRHGEAEARRAAEAEAEQALAVRTQIIREEAQRRAQEAVAGVREEAQRRVQEAVVAVRDEAQRRAQEAITALHEESQRRATDAIASVRAELERARAADAERLRAEAEQRASEAANRVRLEMEQAFAAEREQAKNRAEAEQRALDAANRARLELEQALAAEREQARAREEAEQRAIEAAHHARLELEQTLAAEREEARLRAESEERRAQEEKRRAAEEIERVRASLEAMRAADREAHDTARAALEAELAARATRDAEIAERAPAGIAPDRLVEALRVIDGADSVSSTLAAIGRAAAQHAARATVFVASGEQLREWDVPGVASLTPAPLYVRDSSIGIVGEAVRRRELVRADNGGAPAFASLGSGRMAVATPLLLDGQPVGVVYGDEGVEGSSAGDQWVDALDVIASHGSARLGYITALRTAQANKWLNGNGAAATLPAASSSDEEEQAARRYARLLVSEIKLYNEAAVSAGRENHDLLRRLGADIDRARRLFDERVPASVRNREQLFRHELINTLAGGDPSLLG